MAIVDSRDPLQQAENPARKATGPRESPQNPPTRPVRAIGQTAAPNSRGAPRTFARSSTPPTSPAATSPEDAWRPPAKPTAAAIAGPDSGYDFLVDFENGVTLCDIGGLEADLEDLLGAPVDVVPRSCVRESCRAMLDDAIPL